jgi:hypothetical protein
MKKLKKVLSLVLVLAMALSVFGVCASATNVKDYSDYSEITYTEAVGVLSGLGVLEGSVKDGVSSFKPTDTMNRAEAAKIATYLIDVQDTVVDATTFTDVEGWAKSYIAIAQSQGLINGRNATTYDPAGTLTGYEWEKIVLCAIGYDANIEGLVGATWQASTAVLAGKVGLLEGMNDDYNPTKAITREQAALIAYNALYAQTVLYPTTIDKIAHFGDKTLGELIFGLDVDYSYDIYAAPTTQNFTKKGEVAAQVPVVALAEANNTANLTVADVAALADLTKKDTVNVYVDGTKVGTYAADAKTALDAGLGSYVAIYNEYKDGDRDPVEGAYRIVVINAHVKVLGTTDVVRGTGATAEPYINLGGIKYVTSDFKAGDVVYYNVGVKAGQKVADNVTTPAPESSYVAARNEAKKYVKLGETTADATYFSYKAATEAATTVANVFVDKTYDFYYDNFGNILYSEVSKTVEPQGEYVYLIKSQIETEAVKTGAALTAQTTKVTTAEAKIMHTDGTIEIVTLATGAAKGDNYLLNKYGKIAGTALPVAPNATLSSQNVVTADEQFVTMYTLDDGTKVIEEITDGATVTNLSDNDEVATIEAAKAVVTVNTAKKYATSNTVLNVVAVDTAKYAEDGVQTVTTGYTNFKAASYSEVLVTYAQNGTIDTIYAVVPAEKTVKTETVYALYLGDTEETNADGRALVFGLANGETVTYNLAEVANASDAAAINTTVTAKNTVYTLTITDGKLSAAVAKPADYKAHTQYKDAGYVLRDGAQDVDYLASGVTMAWDITGKAAEAVTVQEALSDNSATPTTYKGDYVYLYTDKDGKVVFIVKPADLEQTAKTVTFTATLVNRNTNAYWFVDVAGESTGGDTNQIRWINAKSEETVGNAPYYGQNKILAGNASLYEGKTFTVSYKVDLDCEGNFITGSKTDVSVTALEDGFYVYKDDGETKTLTYVDASVDGGKTEYTLNSANTTECTDNLPCTYIVVTNGVASVVSEKPSTSDGHYTFIGGATTCSVTASHATVKVYEYKA